MIRKNVASQTVYLPQLRLTADGSAVTTGASLVVAKDGVEAAAAGTLAHYAGGIWKYTPTQGETNCAIMALVLTATGADTVLLNILTTAANPQDGSAFGLSTINTIDSATDATIAVVNDLDARIPAALVSGRMDSSVGAMAANVLTSSAIASDAITDAKVASDVTIASVTGAVGSVTNPVTLTVAYDAAKTASTQTSVNTLATYVDTEVAAIKAKTDNLPVDPADASDIAASFATVNSTLATIAGYIDTEVAAIKAKTDNLPIDPADASDIAASFASLTSLVNTLTGYVDTEVAAIKAKTDNLPASPAAVSDIPTANQNRDALLNALPSAGYVDGSFGDRWLISSGDQRTVAVTGSNHIAADIHHLQAGVITAGKFAAGAIDANALAADAATEIATAVAATQALTRLDSMIESDGAGQFRFDTIALSMGAGGAGGTDWTANERTAIRSILGIPGSGTTPTDPTVGILDEIRDKTNLITTGTIASSIPVTASGQIDGPLVIGDDYLSANGRAFAWTVALPSAFVIATSTCKFGMQYQDEDGTYSFNVAGTVTDAGSGNVTLTFDVPKATTGTLGPGWYRWSVEIASASGTEVTRVKSSHNKLVEWVEKQT